MEKMKCARPDCPETFEPRTFWHKYCSPKCSGIMRSRRHYEKINPSEESETQTENPGVEA